MKFLAAIPVLALFSACSSPNDPGVGNVTRAEAEALNEAAEELNQDQPPPSLVTKGGDQAPAPNR